MGDVRRGLDELFDWLTADRKAAVAEARSAFEESATDMWGKDDAKIVEYLRGRGVQLWLAKESLKAAQERWPGRELSRFNVASGMTQAAQKLPIDRRYEVEQAAAALFTA